MFMAAIFVDFVAYGSTYIVDCDFHLPRLVAMEMEYFDKRMALDVIEDALTTLRTPEDRGLAIGLCGAFYMCGLLSRAEWEALLARIPAGEGRAGEACATVH